MGAISGTIPSAIFGAIFGAILGAIWGAILGASDLRSDVSADFFRQIKKFATFNFQVEDFPRNVSQEGPCAGLHDEKGRIEGT